MHLIGIALLAQLAAPARQVTPVLEFPEPGVDDTASYHGYQTRFLRDAAGNTVQAYLDRRDGRVVNLWADAEDESIGFTARAADGQPVPLHWAGSGATIARSGRTRTVEYDLAADAPRIALGWFLLGSMRVERDFQYASRHLAPFAAPRFALPELERLVPEYRKLVSHRSWTGVLYRFITDPSMGYAGRIVRTREDFDRARAAQRRPTGMVRT